MSITSWDEEFTSERSLEILTRIALEHCQAAGSPAEAIARLINDRDWFGLVHYEHDNSLTSLSVEQHTHIRQALGLFQKLEWLDVGIDKEAVALSKFLAGEERCRKGNALFDLYESGEFSFPPVVSAVLHSAARKISKVLGDVPKLSELRFSFGPGANTAVPKRSACPRIKLGARITSSANLVGLLPTFFREVPHWSALHSTWSVDDEGWLVERVSVDITDSTLAFATKNAKTYRTIQTEPSANGVIQRAYGEVMFERVKRVGIDLRRQDLNKIAARLASIAGDEATLDLVNASGNIFTNLVRHTFPYEWFAALSDCRSQRTCYTDEDGTEHRYILESFSTMGNGFTFPLQSLLFWALVTSCDEEHAKRVKVYGDDIICHVDSVPVIKQVFTSLGFEINLEKSFWEGPFRESCGGDYYLGIDIRPFYQKKLVSGITLFSLYNHYIRRWDMDMAQLVLGYIPEPMRLFGPDSFGDGHLLELYPSSRQHKREDGWGGYVFDTYKQLGVYDKDTRNKGGRVLPIYSIYVNEKHQQSEPKFFRFKHDSVSIRRCNRDVLRQTLKDVAYNFCEAPTPLPTATTGNTFPGTLGDGTPTIFRERKTLQALPGTKGYKRISIYTFCN
jgi:hypothetical protein